LPAPLTLFYQVFLVLTRSQPPPLLSSRNFYFFFPLLDTDVAFNSFRLHHFYPKTQPSPPPLMLSFSRDLFFPLDITFVFSSSQTFSTSLLTSDLVNEAREITAFLFHLPPIPPVFCSFSRPCSDCPPHTTPPSCDVPSWGPPR